MRPHRSHRAYRVPLIGLSVAAVAIAAGCSSSGGSTGHTASGSKSPLVIGASLSLTGDFSADGQAYQKGYDFWAAEVNAAGGILGRKVQMKILNDNSSPSQVVTNYQTLISSDHVALTFGPFSSLLTAPASAVAHRYGYAFVEGAGGATSVFAQKLNNVFDVSLPVANELDPFTTWIKSLPAGQRPATAAYPMANDPFATPQVQRTQSQLQALGIRTVYSQVFPEEVADYKAPADDVATSKAAGGGAGLDRRADRVRVHVRVRAAALQPEGLHRRGRPGPGQLVHQRGRGEERQRDDGARRLVPGLDQQAQPGHGQGVRGPLRRPRVRYQRRRGRGLLGRRGRRPGRDPPRRRWTTPS